MMRPWLRLAQLINLVAIAINVWAVWLDLRRGDWHAAGWQTVPFLVVLLVMWGIACAEDLRAIHFAAARVDLEFRQTMLEKLRAAQDLSISGAVDVDEDEEITH